MLFDVEVTIPSLDKKEKHKGVQVLSQAHDPFDDHLGIIEDDEKIYEIHKYTIGFDGECMSGNGYLFECEELTYRFVYYRFYISEDE